MSVNPFNYNIDYFDSLNFGPISDSQFLTYLSSHNLQNIDPAIANTLGITTPSQGGFGVEYDVSQSQFNVIDVPDLLTAANTPSEVNSFTQPLEDNLSRNPSFNDLTTWYPNYASIFQNENDTYKSQYGLPTTLTLGFAGNIDNWFQDGLSIDRTTQIIENEKKQNKYGPKNLISYDSEIQEILIKGNTGLIEYNLGVQGDLRDELLNRTLGVGVVPFSTQGSGINYLPDGQNISELDKIARERRGAELKERIRINSIDQTVGIINTSPFSLFAGGSLVLSDFKITRAANIALNALDTLGDVAGFSIPVSYLQDYDFNISIFNKDGTLSNQAAPGNIKEVDIKSGLLDRTGNATRSLIFDAISTNKLGPNLEGSYEKFNKGTYLTKTEITPLNEVKEDQYGGFFSKNEPIETIGVPFSEKSNLDGSSAISNYLDYDKTNTTYKGTVFETDQCYTQKGTIDENFDWRLRNNNYFKKGILSFTQNLVNKSKRGDAGNFIGYFNSAESFNGKSDYSQRNDTDILGHSTGVKTIDERPTRMSAGNTARNYNFNTETGGEYYTRSWSTRRKYSTWRDLIRSSGNWWRGQENNENMTMNWNEDSVGMPKIAFEKEDLLRGFVTNQNSITAKAIPYMFSIENLAWKDAPHTGALPKCEIGPNGGRIMWFPPYDINFSESVSVNWDATQFIGRGENVYTYNNTERSGTLDFTIIVDHPAALNELREKFKSNFKNPDSVLHSFFAGTDIDSLKSVFNNYLNTPQEATAVAQDIYNEYLRQRVNPLNTLLSNIPTPGNNILSGKDIAVSFILSGITAETAVTFVCPSGYTLSAGTNICCTLTGGTAEFLDPTYAQITWQCPTGYDNQNVLSGDYLICFKAENSYSAYTCPTGYIYSAGTDQCYRYTDEQTIFLDSFETQINYTCDTSSGFIESGGEGVKRPICIKIIYAEESIIPATVVCPVGYTATTVANSVTCVDGSGAYVAPTSVTCPPYHIQSGTTDICYNDKDLEYYQAGTSPVIQTGFPEYNILSAITGSYYTISATTEATKYIIPSPNPLTFDVEYLAYYITGSTIEYSGVTCPAGFTFDIDLTQCKANIFDFVSGSTPVSIAQTAIDNGYTLLSAITGYHVITGGTVGDTIYIATPDPLIFTERYVAYRLTGTTEICEITTTTATTIISSGFTATTVTGLTKEVITQIPKEGTKIYYDNGITEFDPNYETIPSVNAKYPAPEGSPDTINIGEAWLTGGYPCYATYDYLNGSRDAGLEKLAAKKLDDMAQFLVTEDGKNFKIKIEGYSSLYEGDKIFDIDVANALADQRAAKMKQYLLLKMVQYEEKQGGPPHIQANNTYPQYPKESSLADSLERWSVDGNYTHKDESDGININLKSDVELYLNSGIIISTPTTPPPSATTELVTGKVKDIPKYNKKADPYEVNDPCKTLEDENSEEDNKLLSNSRYQKGQRYVSISLIPSTAIQASLLRNQANSETDKANEQLIEDLAKFFITECEYFEAMKREQPFIYESLKEKIKYFHPAFHSMTPEGLNSRLTFLHQCTRQGPQMLASDVPSNMVFGRPPICILRIGDFYNTKIVIENVNITYDPLQWDLNPEGIGVQPMLAKVSMGFKFIGGSSLGGPIKQLQNAVSYNYYANAGIYNPATLKTDGKTSFVFGGVKSPQEFNALTNQNASIVQFAVNTAIQNSGIPSVTNPAAGSGVNTSNNLNPSATATTPTVGAIVVPTSTPPPPTPPPTPTPPSKKFTPPPPKFDVDSNLLIDNVVSSTDKDGNTTLFTFDLARRNPTTGEPEDPNAGGIGSVTTNSGDLTPADVVNDNSGSMYVILFNKLKLKDNSGIEPQLEFEITGGTFVYYPNTDTQPRPQTTYIERYIPNSASYNVFILVTTSGKELYYRKPINITET